MDPHTNSSARPAPPPLMYASPQRQRRYESAWPRAKRVIIVLWIGIIAQLIMIWPGIDTILQYQQISAGQEITEDFRPVDIFTLVGSLSFVVAYVLGVIFWMMWVHRTYRNLPALGAEGLNYSAGWAVGYYFIPILNLFRPFQVMRETWRASDPQHRGGLSWQLIAAPAVLGIWWAMHLISNVLNQISFRISLRSEDVEVLLPLAWLDLGLLGFDIALMLVEIWIVRRLTDLQQERAVSFAV